MNQLPDNLFNAGFLLPAQRKNYDYHLYVTSKIHHVAKWIENNLAKGDSINHEWNSYTLKCLYRDLTGQEISNGEFIAGMIEAGFRYSRSGLNGLFNVCGKSISDVEAKAYVTLSVKMQRGGAFFPSVQKFNQLSLTSKATIIKGITKGQQAGKPLTHAYLSIDAQKTLIRFIQDEKGNIIEAEASAINEP